ncbi:MAG: beta-propeller fold lactonase family protein [Scytonema sp. PMC 1069.18]|nr:beta-propeller fold lactonase family protein [Scytonema sp. PMC 1069.18]MEC4887345.1 beta-propeller fold lactonase family protein [Scytonema sp. PMC 1070.18]
MHLTNSLRTFKRKWSRLLLGLVTFVIIVTLGVTTFPVLSAMINAQVGSYPNGVTVLPTGVIVTPTATPGSTFERLTTGLRSDGSADANGAVATTLNPDGKTLLVLTSGYNRGYRDENTGESITYPVLDPTTGTPSTVTTNKVEWVFVYSVGNNGTLTKQQQINLPNTFNGIAWASDSHKFYVSAGIDDRIYAYRSNGGEFVPDAPFILLGHNSNQTEPFPGYDGGLLKGTPAARTATGAVVAGLDVSKDGKTLVAANFENDSISIVNTDTRQVVQEIKFFEPGSQVATGEYPFDVALMNNKLGAATKAFVSSQRDDEVLAVDLASGEVVRIPVEAQPNKLLLSANQTRLYVANGNSDTISVIDTRNNHVVNTFALGRQSERYKGANPNSLALSPDQKTLYVTLGGENAIAVIDLNTEQVTGRIPTGWYPNSVSVSPDGKTLYVVNSKGNSGPNPSGGRSTEAGKARNTTFRNEYVFALAKGGVSTIPVPDKETLANLTHQVDENNGFEVARRQSDRTLSSLENPIKHIVYVIKENRTYDQVLGDLPIGNGDPELTLFPEPISPNHHKLAKDFVTFDNFYDSGLVSGDGWGWSTFGRTTDYTEKTVSVLYGNGFTGLTYDYEGNNRFVLPALPNTSPNPNQLTVRYTTLLDPSGSSSILPGTKDISAPVGANDLDAEAIGGYLWDSALRSGKTVRAYGVVADLSDVYYSSSSSTPTQPDPNNQFYIPISPHPFKDGIPQAPATKPSLQGRTDIYFRGYDQKNTDIYSVNEWRRDLEAYIQENGTMPNLMVMALDHDHFGSFGNAVAGVNTPELQMADNDYALGLIVDYLTHRPEWKETAVVVVEDDAQDGPDHVDAHRSLAYIISPYTQTGQLISTRYTTVNIIRTIEDLLGIDYLGITDANARPMSDAFTTKANLTPYTAIVPGNLCQSPVDPNLVPACQNPDVMKSAAMPISHDKNWWAKATANFYFDGIDKLDAEAFNRVLWTGIKGDEVPYPTARNGRDLRHNREQLLALQQNKA